MLKTAQVRLTEALTCDPVSLLLWDMWETSSREVVNPEIKSKPGMFTSVCRQYNREIQTTEMEKT